MLSWGTGGFEGKILEVFEWKGGEVMREFVSGKVKEVFGENFVVVEMERLLGGAQKYTYRVKCENGFEFVVYEWAVEKSYFEYDGGEAVFRSSSAELFERNNGIMVEHGVRTPKLYFMDRSKREWSCEYAFVEYVSGVDMDYVMEKEPERLPRVMESLVWSINRLHGIKSLVVGQLGRLQSEEFSVVEYELEGIVRNCLFLCEKDSEYGEVYRKVLERAREIVHRIGRRGEYAFVHGELGPNHVMVDSEDNAYLIDIEGARFCDVEAENSFLRLRFDGQLVGVRDDVDEERMEFYRIGHCFGNLRGAIELREKGYYDMDDLNGMIEFFHGEFCELGMEC